MPFTIFSHQAPVVPLKLWRPALFSGTALVFGSMAPDIEYFFLPHPIPVHGHFLWGQFYFCLPVTFCLVLLLRWMAPTLAPQLPDLGPFHLRDMAVLGRARLTSVDFLRIVTSALLGSFSHLLADGFTHYDGFGAALLPGLKVTVGHPLGHTMSVARTLQYVLTVAFGAATIAMAHHVGKHRLLLKWSGVREQELSLTRQVSPRVFWGITMAMALGGGGLRMFHDRTLFYLLEPILWGHEAFQFACYLFLALCVATSVTRLFPSKVAPPLAVRQSDPEGC